ncbi:hypothetical protein AN478_05765 [Thiohalorhabdus denitrificans]|uniref:Peptidoglycan-binding protein, CsiV n=1 Tax=Thiohalorhabdus denitrificans TaxID=381306 RepID=A0A0P9C6D1_9GAMM|nr:hypothetical protein [Thiohalorhabdus denitrificans]KPV40665.1 hypothetical protein AN478_05765 [Thiohalorhabdus denitrificans]SCY47617.1 hypothetical protein SAMN05661077_2225 [Thiohalorhabdus denitrificans]
MSAHALAGFLLALVTALWTGPAAAESEIGGVYSLELGQSRERAEQALADDEHFRRIAARHFEGFPLYEVTLGSHEFHVHPRFRDDRLAEITLQFQEKASSNDVDPLIHEQLAFGLSTFRTRFGEPDQVFLEPREVAPRDFEEDDRVVTHQWTQGERVAQLLLWREGFTYGAEILLAEQSAREPEGSPAEAF